MKKLLICLAALAIVACKQEPKDYVTFSGKITDKNSDSVVVRNRTYSKTIKVNEDGTFKDTLKVETGMYAFYDGAEQTSVFLKNGYDININLDTKMFDESIKYSGVGAETNNYLAEKSLLQEKIYPPSLFDLEEESFKKKVDEINSELSSFLENNKDIDSTLFANEKSELEKFESNMLTSYGKQKEYLDARAKQFAKFIGNPSPTFENYENYKGGETSLDDLKGKYVYIDIWATWCGPCKAEIPSLKEVEKDYHGKNIEFVSISVDNGRGYKEKTVEASKIGWKEMIAQENLGGIQLFSDNAWKSDFITGYEINSIPRFILIDPAGNVVNADAPRPSSPKLRTLFDALEL